MLKRSIRYNIKMNIIQLMLQIVIEQTTNGLMMLVIKRCWSNVICEQVASPVECNQNFATI